MFDEFPRTSSTENSKMSPKFCMAGTRIPYHIDQCFFRATQEVKSYGGGELLHRKFAPSPNGQQLADRAMNVPTSLNVSSTSTRGPHRPLDGLSSKIERFKIRTVLGADVVKEEEENK